MIESNYRLTRSFLGFWFSYIIQFSRNDFESKPLKTEQNKRTCAGFRLQLRRILRKEVIQPHLPIRLPCYDFTPIICPTFGGWLQQGVTPPTSGVTNSRGVTGGVYKTRERIHRGILIRDY